MERQLSFYTPGILDPSQAEVRSFGGINDLATFYGFTVLDPGNTIAADSDIEIAILICVECCAIQHFRLRGIENYMLFPRGRNQRINLAFAHRDEIQTI